MIANFKLVPGTPAVMARQTWQWVDVPCPVCGHDDAQPVFQAPGWGEHAERIFAVVQCAGCRVWYTNPMPYPLPQSDLDPLADQKMERYIGRKIAAQLDNTNARERWLVHFGLAEPSLPRLAAQRGWRVMLWRERPCQIPPSWFAAGGLAIFGSLEEVVENFHSQVACITCAGWLERQADLPQVVTIWRTLLQPTGRMLLFVPNLRGTGLARFGGLWRGLDLPYRRVHFTAETLGRFLQTSGWHIHGMRTYHARPWLWESAQRWKNWFTQTNGSIARWYRDWVRTCPINTWLAALVGPIFGRGDWLFADASPMRPAYCKRSQ